MGSRVSYPAEVKMTAVETRLAGILVKEAMAQLNIRHHTQLKRWVAWYKNGKCINVVICIIKNRSF
ncbi:hypothetical protein [Domibacillus tundrae]|uniref:hypothetical protein n=1 Tax=Domibacillus tundrae TaxID=1587527 RepID=UPI003EC0072F